MKQFRLITAAIGLFALAACTENDESNGNPDGRTALQISTASITTRATDNAWEAGDAIGITLFDAGTKNPVDGKTACKYVTATAAGAFAPADNQNTAYFPTQGKEADVIAFYPYTALAADLLIPVNTADQQNLAAIDLMTAELATGHSATKPDVTLTFKHRLTKLAISVEKEASAADVDLTGATVTISGTATTAKWSLAEGKLTNEGIATDIAVPAIATKDALTATAIVLPTIAGKGVKLVIATAAGKQFDAPLASNLELLTGTVNTLKVKLQQTAATVNATVTDWATGHEVELEPLKMEITNPDATANGINALTLWMQSNPTAKANYTFADNQWSSDAPFYLENLTDGAAFFARHTPTTTDAVTGLADVLGNTTAATISGGSIALPLSHLYAKLNIALTRDANFPTAIPLTGATIKLNGFQKSTSIDDANSVSTSGNAEAYTLTVDQAGNASLIVAPQTIAAATDFTVTLSNGNTYTAKLASAITLEGGKIHTLALTLSPSAASLAVSVTDWAVGGTSNQSIVVDGISTDTASGGTLAPGAGDQLALTYLANGALSTDATQKATYTYAANAWSSAAPLYWDAIGAGATGTTHSFVALYTPAATPAAGCVSDYLTGKTTAAFGAPILFTTDATKLTHAMSQISITLLPGKGYAANPASPTDPEKNALIAALTTRHLVLNSLQSIAVDKDGQGVVTLAAAAPANILAAATDKNFASGTTYTVAPQTLTDAHTVVLKLANGNAYTLKLADLKTTGGDALFGADKKMMPGTQYAVTITVSETEVSFAASIRPWNSISGSGEVVPGI